MCPKQINSNEWVEKMMVIGTPRNARPMRLEDDEEEIECDDAEKAT